MKLGIVGTGMVGSAAGFAVALTVAVSEMVLIDQNPARALAEAEDIAHAVPFGRPLVVRSGDYTDLKGAEVVILAAGVNQAPGETRLDLLGRNAAVFQAIVPQVIKATPEAILLIATNPVDIMTDIATRISGLPASRVIGSGTILDTARFRSLLGQHLGISPQSVHAYVLGEHGDSEVLGWSGARAGTLPLRDFAAQMGAPITDAVVAQIDERTRRAAYRIIEGKGATWYGIGAGLARIVRAIAGDERAVLSVSMRADFPGLGDVALSVPRVVGRAGVMADLMPDLNEREAEALKASARMLWETAGQIRM